MHLVVDAVAGQPGSVAIVLEHVVRAWSDTFPEDEVTVLYAPGIPPFDLPPAVRTEVLPSPAGPLGRAWLRTGAVRRAARRLGADAVLVGVPAGSLFGTGCPRGVVMYDLRFELRPEQFSRRTRVARRLSWAWSLRRADGVFCISDRTRDDLRRRHPRWARRAVTAALGSDHVLDWAAEPGDGTPYALAFGHFGNKNADAVLEGWAAFCREQPDWRLRLVGMGRADREAAATDVRRLGIEDRVELMPWLDDDAFSRCFAGAGMVVFPSDFEGFGLPAAEALRLGIPTVVSTDPALAEVTGGHAVAAPSTSAADLAEAMRRALALTAEELAAGRDFAQDWTWSRTASVIRAGLLPDAGARMH